MALVLLWEGIARLGGVSPLLLPPFSQVALRLFEELLSGALARQVAYSLGITLLGVALSAVLALLLVLLSLLGEGAKNSLEALVSLAHPLPGIALLPLVILFTGIGTFSLLVIIIHSVLWPLVVSLLAGISGVPSILKDVGRNYGLKGRKLLFHVYLPSALPSLISGLKIGWARSWRAFISAEMVFGLSGRWGGLGWFLFEKRVFMDTTGLYAGILVLILLGLLVENVAFSRIEEVTVNRWGGAL